MIILDLLVWPVTTFALFKGALTSYKTLNNDKDKKKVLEYWVVLIFIIYLFPWLEYISGWFMLGGLVTIIKLVALFAVASPTKGYGWLYTLIDEQFIPLIDPYVNHIIEYSSGFRTIFCDHIILGLHYIFYNIFSLLDSEMSKENLDVLKIGLTKTLALITKDEKKRQKQSKSEEALSVFDKISSDESELSKKEK